MAGKVILELGYLTAVEKMGPWNDRDQVAALYFTGWSQEGHNLFNDQADQSGSQGGLIHRELRRWLIEHDIPGQSRWATDKGIAYYV